MHKLFGSAIIYKQRLLADVCMHGFMDQICFGVPLLSFECNYTFNMNHTQSFINETLELFKKFLSHCTVDETAYHERLTKSQLNASCRTQIGSYVCTNNFKAIMSKS